MAPTNVRCSPVGPINTTVYGKGLCRCDQVQDLGTEILPWSGRWVLDAVTSVLMRRSREETGQRQKRGRPCDPEAGMSVMQLFSQGMLVGPWSWTRPGTESPWSFWKEHGPANTFLLPQQCLFQSPGLQNRKRISFCCFEPPSLW